MKGDYFWRIHIKKGFGLFYTSIVSCKIPCVFMCSFDASSENLQRQKSWEWKKRHWIHRMCPNLWLAVLTCGNSLAFEPWQSFHLNSLNRPLAVHNEYGWYSWEGGSPPGSGPVGGTATSPPPPPDQPPPAPPAPPPLRLAGLHCRRRGRQRDAFPGGRASALLCRWERGRGQRGAAGAARVSGLLGLLGAGDSPEPDHCRHQRLPGRTGVRVHPDTGHRHGGVWLPVPLHGECRARGVGVCVCEGPVTLHCGEYCRDSWWKSPKKTFANERNALKVVREFGCIQRVI